MPGRMRITNHEGHTTVAWPTPGETKKRGQLTPAQVDEKFNELMAYNNVAFDVTDADNPKKLEKFDPSVEDITVIAPMAGGCD